MPDRCKVLVVYGTRPEAVKMAPLVLALRRSQDVQVRVAVTGQHREMLDQVNKVFGITPDDDLNIIRPRQSLPQVTTAALEGLTGLIQRERPDAVIVQGDTTTAFCGALAAFYEQVPVAHLEAGLRTGQIRNPFPEEANRRLISRLADLHLAPTARARRDLEAEGVDASTIVVTGNTVVDALLWTVAQAIPYVDEALARFVRDHPVLVLVTAHRRESWGAPMHAIGSAVAALALAHPRVGFVLPAHLNPTVREILLPPVESLANVLVTDPLAYGEFCRLMSESSIILTDSGGVQEEAPSLGSPVLVMRETTERPEGIAAGVAQLVGTDRATIVSAVDRLLTAPRDRSRSSQRNPYGDGLASERAAAAVRALLGVGVRLPEFELDEARR